MWPNPQLNADQETADLVTFTGEILNEKFHFLWRVTCYLYFSLPLSYYFYHYYIIEIIILSRNTEVKIFGKVSGATKRDYPEVDGCPSKENLFGQSALSMNATYIVFLWGDLQIHGIIIASGMNFCH